jgi:hypothetical protein
MMEFFRSRSPQQVPSFSSRAEAFSYMLSRCLEQGDEPMRAAEKADTFANLFASNMGLPTSSVPPPEGMDKYLGYLQKASTFCEEHPKAVELVVGVVSFLAGSFVGRKAEQDDERPHEPQHPPIDFSAID